MLTYRYVARDPGSGRQVKAELQADSEKAAANMIKQQGLTPISIDLQSNSGLLSKYTNRISTKDKILFSRQLSTLINAGLPLVQSLRNVLSQTQNKALKTVLAVVITDVEAGKAFSAALGRHPDVFNPIFINMVAAGEVSGTLDRTLERLANQQEKDAEVVAKVKGAMIYPIIVMGVMLAVVGFMIIKVLPSVKVLYAGFPGADLPLVTKILLAVSDATIQYWPFLVGTLVFIGVVTGRWAQSVGGKYYVDRIKMTVWPLGPLFMKVYMARFARTGATLIASGVPLLQMMEVTARAINNVHLEKSLMTAAEKVKGGKALSESIRGDASFLPLVPDMLSIGEQSGAIEQMMEKVADYYEKEVDTQIKNISTIIEPVLMVFLGVFALIIVAAVLLPVYGLAGKGF